MRRCPKCNSFFDNDATTCVYDGEQLVDVQVEASQNEGLEGSIVNDRYEVVTSIGEGGMGMVYKAIDQRSGDTVALKVLHRDISGDERTVRRFFSEARVLASLTHPNIIRLYDFGRTSDGLLYIAMELLSGKPVDDMIRLNELPLEDALQIIDQTASALAEAHLQGVIHRDLKPANIFMDKAEDGAPRVTVLDFGIAKIAGSGQNLTATGKVMGTPSYMAPEQIRGQAPDPRTDIYALGAMGYELISGQPPFLADGPIAVLFMHLERPPTPLSTLDLKEDVSQELSDVIDGFLAKKPDERPRNMMEVRKLLRPFIDPHGEMDDLNVPEPELSLGLPQVEDVYKKTVPFDAEKAVAEAQRRAAAMMAKQEEEHIATTGMEGLSEAQILADAQQRAAKRAAAEKTPPRTSPARSAPPKHDAKTAALPRKVAPTPPPAQPTPAPQPPQEEEGISMLWWLIAMGVVVILAILVTMLAFIFIFPQNSQDATSSWPPSSPALEWVADATPNASSWRGSSA